MTIIDVVILVVIGISFLIGLVRGFVRETLSLITWAVALWAAFTFADRFTQHFEQFLSDPTLRLIASFIVVFIITLVLLSLIGFFLSSVFESTGLTGIDRSLGGVFGILRGAIIVAVLIILAGFTGFPNEPWWQESVLIDHFKPLVIFIHDLIPNNLSDYLNKT